MAHLRLRLELAAVDDLGIDRFGQAHLSHAIAVLAADLSDVPDDVAALDHSSELAEVGGARVDDLDAGVSLEVVEIVLPEGGDLGAAGGVDDKLFRLGRLCLSKALCRGSEHSSRSSQYLSPSPHGALPLLVAAVGHSSLPHRHAETASRTIVKQGLATRV